MEGFFAEFSPPPREEEKAVTGREAHRQFQAPSAAIAGAAVKMMVVN